MWQQGSAHRSSIQITTASLIAENQPRASTSSKATRLSARRGAFTFCTKASGDKGTFSQPTYQDLRCRAGNDAGNLDSGTRSGSSSSSSLHAGIASMTKKVVPPFQDAEEVASTPHDFWVEGACGERFG